MKDVPKGHLPEHRNTWFIQGNFFTKYAATPLSVAEYLRVVSLGTFYDLNAATPTILRRKCKEFLSAHRSCLLSTLSSKNYSTAVVIYPAFCCVYLYCNGTAP
jgi:hypothetical protein